MTTTTPQRRFGFKRWLVLGMIVLGAYLAFGMGGVFTPISPAVVLPPEPIWYKSPITNTMLATLLADLILFIIAFSAYRFVRSGQMVPRGFYNFFEAIIEFLWNATESAAGRWAKRIFPFMATIFLLVLVANLTKLIPGFEAIGYMKEAHGTITGYEPVPLAGGAWALDGSVVVPHLEDGEHVAAGGAPCHSCEVVPSLRGAATDLNFTFALAIIVVVMIQAFGIWALGARYFGKFFNTGGMISRPFFGVIDFGVGLLELVSEFSKVLSFGFRLFGNIFAGGLLLAILGSLTVIVVPSFIFTLEIIVGVIQAYVFSMLALVFMSQATVSHHGDDHADHAEAPAH